MKNRPDTKKLLSRARLVFAAGAYRITGILSNVVISLFIIRYQSIKTWGEVVPLILFIDLGFTIVSWGNTTYLSRVFSKDASKISLHVITSSLSRSLLLLLFLIVIWCWPFADELRVALTTWSIGRFIYQCFEPLTLFERNFIFAFCLEVTSILIITIPIATGVVAVAPLTIVFLYAISFLIRAIAAMVFYSRFYIRKELSVNSISIIQHLRAAAPFLLLTASAMLQQRIDLYIVAFLLESEQTASYQVFISFLLMGQLGASLLLSPFAKNIFRMADDSVRALEKKVIRSGFILSLLTMFFIYIFLQYLYKIELSFVMYSMGYFYILMFYLYVIKNYEMGKAFRQVHVALYSFAGFACNIALSFLLIPRFGIEGAMLSGLLSQGLMTILYHMNGVNKYIHATR